MKRVLVFLAGIGALLFLASCEDPPTGHEPRLDQPASISSTPIARNPFDAPDESGQPYVPGQ